MVGCLCVLAHGSDTSSKRTVNCRQKTYILQEFLGFMVLIECPHCEGHTELDDDAVGLFACPHCENGMAISV